MLDHVIEPVVSVEEIEVPREETGSPQPLDVARGNFVGSEHVDDHAVVTEIVVEGLDDPVSPPPDALLAVSHLLAESEPVGVPPDVHPVSSPPLAVMGALQQAVDDLRVGSGGLVREELVKLLAGGGEADQVK